MCPARLIHARSYLIYNLFRMAHTEQEGWAGLVWTRNATMTEMMALPQYLTEAFDLILAELRPLTPANPE